MRNAARSYSRALMYWNGFNLPLCLGLHCLSVSPVAEYLDDDEFKSLAHVFMMIAELSRGISLHEKSHFFSYLKNRDVHIPKNDLHIPHVAFERYTVESFQFFDVVTPKEYTEMMQPLILERFQLLLKGPLYLKPRNGSGGTGIMRISIQDDIISLNCLDSIFTRLYASTGQDHSTQKDFDTKTRLFFGDIVYLGEVGPYTYQFKVNSTEELHQFLTGLEFFKNSGTPLFTYAESAVPTVLVDNKTWEVRVINLSTTHEPATPFAYCGKLGSNPYVANLARGGEGVPARELVSTAYQILRPDLLTQDREKLVDTYFVQLDHASVGVVAALSEWLNQVRRQYDLLWMYDFIPIQTLSTDYVACVKEECFGRVLTPVLTDINLDYGLCGLEDFEPEKVQLHHAMKKNLREHVLHAVSTYRGIRKNITSFSSAPYTPDG